MSKKSKRAPLPPEPPPPAARVLPAASREQIVQTLEGLACAPPHRGNWLLLCAWIEQLHRQHGDATTTIDALRSRVCAWPSRIRMAPWLWINKLIDGALPLAALGLCSGLPLSAAIGDNAAQNPRRESLLQWLRALPSDAPALDALLLSWRKEAYVEMLHANVIEPDLRAHATLHVERQHHWEEGILEAVLRSPLARSLTALDLSLAIPHEDFYESRSGGVDGNTAALSRVLSLLGADERISRLSLLDLRGNRLTYGDLALRDRYALPALQALSLGMSEPLGDRALKTLAASAPSLEWLDLVPDCTGWLLETPFDALGEDERSRIENHWSIVDPRAPQRFTAPAMQTLLDRCPALRVLLLQRTYLEDPAIAALFVDRPSLRVAALPPHMGSVEFGAWPLSLRYELSEWVDPVTGAAYRR